MLEVYGCNCMSGLRKFNQWPSIFDPDINSDPHETQQIILRKIPVYRPRFSFNPLTS